MENDELKKTKKLKRKFGMKGMWMGNKKEEEGKIVGSYFPPRPTNFDPIEYGGKSRGKT